MRRLSVQGVDKSLGLRALSFSRVFKGLFCLFRELAP